MSQRAPSPGDVIAGRYRIERLLGQGGFGAVYRAVQLNIGRPVALKVLLPEMVGDAEGLGRFRREAQLAQRLSHPNTVRLYDFGDAEGGAAPYIAWELLVGTPLDAALAAERVFPPARVARIASQVLKSLMEAHALGIVHRDIKPANVFLCQLPGEADFVKVLDFGIAKATRSRTLAQLTQAGQTVGTPAYMAPEQVFADQVWPATDLYSLGLLMAEAVSGERVFVGESGVQVCMEQISDKAVPLSRAVLESPLGGVIQRATQKRPENRFASAAEMLAALDAADTWRAGPSAPPLAPPLPAAFTPHAPAPATSAAFANTVATSPPRAAASGGGARVAIALLATALVLVGGGLAALVATGRLSWSGETEARPEAPEAPGRPKPDRPKPARIAGGFLSDRRVAQLTGDIVRGRIQAAGFKQALDVANGVTHSWTVTALDDGDLVGVVQLYHFAANDPLSAGATAAALAETGEGVGAREGQVILWVILDEENVRAKALFDAIAR